MNFSDPLQCGGGAIPWEGAMTDTARSTTIAIWFAVLWFAASWLARADTPTIDPRLATARTMVGEMHEAQRSIAAIEDSAKQARDPIRLNRVHELADRVITLVNVADHALGDMGVAIQTNEGDGAVAAEMEKIATTKSKVDQALRSANDAQSDRVVAVNSGTDDNSYDFSQLTSALSGATSAVPVNAVPVYEPPFYRGPPGVSPTGMR